MADYATNPQALSELDAALNQLETSLVDAGRSVAVVRRNVGQLTALVDVVRELESAMNRARENLGMPAGLTVEAASPTPIRPVPPAEEMYQQEYQRPVQAEPQASALRDEPRYEPPSPEPLPEEPQAGFEPVRAADDELPSNQEEQPGDEGVSHCLRLGVASKAGSLDLKAVDGSVNENPAVVDVALLDYDGRRATLKLWINGMADPVGVRDALLGSLRRRLGDERDAEVQIEFEAA